MRRVRIVFWALEAVLWLGYLALDLYGIADTSTIKFTAILLCAAFAIWQAKDTDGWLIAWALGLSVLADVFLLMLNRHYLLGVGIFVVVQDLHTLRLCRMRGLDARADLILRAVIAALAVAATMKFSALTMLSAAYISWFGLNLAEALIFAKTGKSRAAVIYAAGLALYFCCDLCVGLNFLAPSQLSALAMWAFYLPGQTLIASSVNLEA